MDRSEATDRIAEAFDAYARAVDAHMAAALAGSPEEEATNDAACEAASALAQAMRDAGLDPCGAQHLGEDGEWGWQVEIGGQWITLFAVHTWTVDGQTFHRVEAIDVRELVRLLTPTIVAELTTVEMPEGRASLSVFEVPVDQIGGTTHEWTPRFLVDVIEVDTDADIDEAVGRVLGAEVSLEEHSNDGETAFFRGRRL